MAGATLCHCVQIMPLRRRWIGAALIVVTGAARAAALTVDEVLRHQEPQREHAASIGGASARATDDESPRQARNPTPPPAISMSVTYGRERP